MKNCPESFAWKFWGFIVLTVVSMFSSWYVSAIHFSLEQKGPHEGMGTGTSPHLLQRERLLVYLHLRPSLKVRQPCCSSGGVPGMDALITMARSARLSQMGLSMSVHKTPSPSPAPALHRGHTANGCWLQNTALGWAWPWHRSVQ